MTSPYVEKSFAASVYWQRMNMKDWPWEAVFAAANPLGPEINEIEVLAALGEMQRRKAKRMETTNVRVA